MTLTKLTFQVFTYLILLNFKICINHLNCSFFCLFLGTDEWEYQWEDEEVTEDIRIPMASLNGDIDYDDEEESSAKSSMTNGSNQVISCLFPLIPLIMF